MKRKLLKSILITLVAIFLTIELSLRLIWGFCDAVLMREDKDYEYIAIPQSRKRFGNNIFYNSFSQRNDELSDADSIRIALFGDSIINGGTETDQDSLASTKLSKYLTLKYKKTVKVLNISAGSWGPDNCFAYLKKHGDFNSKKIVLIVSSHDAYDNMRFENIVGKDESYPTQQYPLAILELLERYLLPSFNIHIKASEVNNGLGINKRTYNSSFNSGFQSFSIYCKERHIPFLVYLHAEEGERKLNRYNIQGQEIINFCLKDSIPLIKDLDYSIPLSAYRDEIHFNSRGQEKIFELLKDSL
jgi:hypothetical protein